MKRTRRSLAAATAAALAAQGSWAAAEDAFSVFQEEATVVTATRRPQKISESPVSVEVITAEDIRRSGAVNLWDVLRFRAGMDVVDGRSADGNRALVSVRGFPQEFVGSLLVLVDGRTVYNPIIGGTYWQEMPVQLQDIDRVEIVRGPNAALYGSNAGLGVINIITRKPSARAAGEASALAGGYGRRQEAGSLEDARASYGWRVSATNHAEGGFPSATDPNSADFLRSNKANARGWWSPRDGTTIEAFGGSSWERMGVVLNPGAQQQVRYNSHFETAKLEQKTGDRSDLEATLSHTWNAYAVGPGTDASANAIRQYDGEVLHRTGWLDDRLNTALGGSLRYVTAASGQFFPWMKTPSDRVERAFVQQSAKVADSLSLSAAASIENSETGGFQPAYQAAAVYDLRKEQAFRAGYSRSSTLPALFDRNVNFDAAPLHFNGNPGITAAKLTNYELGYEGTWLQRRLKLETNFYYMELRDMLTGRLTPTYFPQFRLNVGFDNSDAAIARGGELKASYRLSRGASVYANYAYERITEGQPAAGGEVGTPRSKVNWGGDFELGHGVRLTANAGFKSRYRITSNSRGTAVDVPPDWRLDARVGWQAAERLELFAAGQNLTRPGRREFADGLTIPAVVSGGFDWKFGGGR